ncbi:MAG TPA: hypothetical protein VII06_09490 [Chloroflexota bacterium]|jgi:hypothetical protein
MTAPATHDPAPPIPDAALDELAAALCAALLAAWQRTHPKAETEAA